MTDFPEISIVVPVYNSVDTLRPLFERSKSTMEAEERSFEFIFILDGINSDCWDELRAIKKDFPDAIRLFNLAKNYGQNAATLCGINHAKGNLIITMDDDLQTPPEEMAKLLAVFAEGEVDVVFGAPIKRNRSKIRQFGAWFGRIWFKAVDGADIGTAFRLIGPRIKHQLNSMNHNLFLNQIIHWHTQDIVTVDVVNEPRQTGRSGYSLLGLFMIMMRLVLFYTDFPLRFMTVFGGLLSLICFGLGAFYIYEKFTLGAELGFTSIIVAIFFATGLILMALSILGMFINRIYDDRSHKPVYSVKTEL